MGEKRYDLVRMLEVCEIVHKDGYAGNANVFLWIALRSH